MMKIRQFFGKLVLPACMAMISAQSLEAHNTWWGPTGLVQMPTTSIVKPQETSAYMYTSFGGGDTFLGYSATFSFSEQVELSIADTAGSSQRKNSSTMFSLKYVPMANLAVGGMFDSNKNFQHTLYTILGSPENSVYLGAGLNFGNGNARKAVLGNYSRVENDMEAIFIMAGAKMDLSRITPSLEGVIEFNGDTMSIGFGYIPKDEWDVQLDYMSSGDLFNKDRFVVSVGTSF